MSEAKIRDLKRTARLIALGRREAAWLIDEESGENKKPHAWPPGLALAPETDASLGLLGLVKIENHRVLRKMVLRFEPRARLTDAGKLEYLRICAALETHIIQSVSNEETPDKPPLPEK